jgi:phospholipid transport system substrate-binding protein
MKFKSVALTGLSIVAIVSGASHAQGYYPGRAAHYPAPRQAEAPNPALILEQGLNKLMTFSGRERRPDKMQIAAFLDQEVAPYFDFSYMARWAAGRMWPRMTPQQRREMEGQLQQMFLGSLATRLLNYRGQQVRVGNPRRARGNELQVPVAVLNPQGYPARLNFRFYRSENGWKVFDVSANGNSALMYYRRHFRNLMRQKIHRGRAYSNVG